MKLFSAPSSCDLSAARVQPLGRWRRALQRQWAAWRQARRDIQEAEQLWRQTLQDAQRMAAQARAMSATARTLR